MMRKVYYPSRSWSMQSVWSSHVLFNGVRRSVSWSWRNWNPVSYHWQLPRSESWATSRIQSRST